MDQYQSINEEDPGTPGAYAETLGVRVGGAGSTTSLAESTAVDGGVDAAHRAYMTMERFRELLALTSGKEVKLSRRILVWCGKWPKENGKGHGLRDVYNDSPVELWTREFLSPSIDCFADDPRLHGGISG